MVMKVLVAEVEEQLFALLDRLRREDEPIFITQDGQTEAVLLSLARYEQLLKCEEDLEDIKAMFEAEADYVAGEGRDFEEFAAELEGGR